MCMIEHIFNSKDKKNHYETFSPQVKLQLQVSWGVSIFAHSSRQNCSSSFKLVGFHWYTSIFKLYHRFSIGLRSGLWLGHSKTFKCFPLKPLECCFSSMLRAISIFYGFTGAPLDVQSFRYNFYTTQPWSVLLHNFVPDLFGELLDLHSAACLVVPLA